VLLAAVRTYVARSRIAAPRPRDGDCRQLLSYQISTEFMRCGGTRFPQPPRWSVSVEDGVERATGFCSGGGGGGGGEKDADRLAVNAAFEYCAMYIRRCTMKTDSRTGHQLSPAVEPPFTEVHFHHNAGWSAGCLTDCDKDGRANPPFGLLSPEFLAVITAQRHGNTRS
jgi:hypothetical protein